MSENFYNILGVDEKATKEEIKKAYRGLQMKWHPDKNQGSEESKIMSEKINGAYEVLGDEEKRTEYDNSRNNPFARMNSQGGGGMEVPMDDIFNMFFGGIPGMGGMGGFPMGGMAGMGGFPGMPPGAKIHVFNGGPMGFQQAISKPTPIMKTIEINMSQVLSGASIPLEIERWIIENGIKVHEKETIYVSVPQGVDDNELLILRDKGTLCGFTFEINYINGKSYTLNNNKGNIIPPEYKKVYPGMGLTRGEHKGNMIIHFHVDFPEKLNEEQIAKIFEAL